MMNESTTEVLVDKRTKIARNVSTCTSDAVCPTLQLVKYTSDGGAWSVSRTQLLPFVPDITPL